MTKWADYCISTVRYNAEHTHIVKVKVHTDMGDNLGNATEWTRTEVVSVIENKKTFVTTPHPTDGKWKKGEDVRTVNVGGVKYIRTDANSKASDNLGSLPEF